MSSIEGLTRIIRDWASARGGVPFTAAQAFESIKDADDAKEVADRVRQLWVKGDLARRKNGDGRYEYVWAARAPAGFEANKPSDAPPAEPAVAPAETPAAAPAAPAQEIPIPESIRKRPAKSEQPQSFSAEAIADALIAKLKPQLSDQRMRLVAELRPMLRSMLADLHLDQSDALEVSASRITVRIKEIEVTVEGLL